VTLSVRTRKLYIRANNWTDVNRALVGLSGASGETELLRTAGELATGVSADLVVLSMIDEDAVDEDEQTLERVAELEHTSYDADVAGIGQADKFGRDAAAEALSGMELDYEVVPIVVDPDEKADSILSAANDYDCDHIFLTGRQRSPTGKAIFGDVTQKVILNFDDDVTVTTR